MKMRKLALTSTAIAMLGLVLVASASAQVAPKQGAQPGGSIAAPAAPAPRTGKPPAASGQTQTPGMSFLTADECKKLGGAVHIAPQCKKTGTRCVVRLAGGQINAPCIDEVSKN
jgi:hypothetical protein